MAGQGNRVLSGNKTRGPIGCAENENGNPQTLPISLIQQIFIKGIQDDHTKSKPLIHRILCSIRGNLEQTFAKTETALS